MPATSASTDLVLVAADGATLIPLMLAQASDDKGNPVERGFAEVLAAASSDSPLSEWLEPVVQESWRRGAGLDYSAAPGCCTRFGAPDEQGVERNGQVFPAGYATEIAVSAAGASDSVIVEIVEYGGDRWWIQAGDGTVGTARVMRQVGGLGALATAFALGANEYLRGAVTADDGAGTQVLFVTSSALVPPVAGLSGRLHKWDGAVWTSTPLGLFGETAPALHNGTKGRNTIVKVNWSIDGVAADRLVCITGPSEIAYTVPNGDPMAALGWVEGVKVATTAGLLSLAAARHHVWAGAADGLFDLQEDGTTPNLIGYDIPRYSGFTGACIKYLNDYVYMTVGASLHRVFVGEQGVLQSTPGVCGPCWGTAAENEFQGPITALGEDQGVLIAAGYNPATARAFVWYGIDRQVAGIASGNPLIWHGPEVVSSTDLMIGTMAVSGLGALGGMWLLLAALPNVAPFTPWIGYVSVPLAGSSLSDLLSGGVHKFALGDGVGTWNATSSLRSLPHGGGDKVSLKIIDANGVTSRGLDGSTLLQVYTRADPAPGSTAWGALTSFISSPVQSGSPTVVTSGYELEYRVDFVSPSGTATPAKVAVLTAFRRTWWRRAPSFLTYVLDVEYGDGVTDVGNGHDDTLSPDDITTLLKLLAESGRTTLRTRDDATYTVVLRQMFEGRATVTDGEPYGKRIRTRLSLAILATA